MVEGTEGSHHKEGSTKMSKHTMICAGIDTGKRKLDVGVARAGASGCRSTTGRWSRGIVGMVAQASRQADRDRGERRLRAGGGRHLRRDGFVVIVFQPIAGAGLCQVSPATGQERQDRCRPDRRLHGSDPDGPCSAGSTLGAICRASDADRAAHRGHRPLQDASRVLSRLDESAVCGARRSGSGGTRQNSRGFRHSASKTRVNALVAESGYRFG